MNSRFSQLKGNIGCWFAASSILCLVTLLVLAKLGIDYFNNISVLYDQKNYTRADLFIPPKGSLLIRSDLVSKMDQHFYEQKGGIKVIALIGIGGAGKTTLARYYALKQNAQVIWEIDSETKEGAIKSFEKLASALANTDKDKMLLKELRQVTDFSRRENYLIQFIRGKLRNSAPWFLIFDNIEKFNDLDRIFPNDTNLWGKGNILITTRNENIQNTGLVPAAIRITELKPKEKLKLFLSINKAGSDASSNSFAQETEKLLYEIPSFPLDVSAAAYYLKATNISHEKYLENLKRHDDRFEDLQQDIHRGYNPYFKSRVGIITLNIMQLVKLSEDFRDLLYLICLLDSQNIPRELLENFKKSTLVDKFIYNMKKYSLITNESHKSSIIHIISMHRSTQEICLKFLKDELQLNESSSAIEAIHNVLKKYTHQANNKSNFELMQLLTTHCTVFLNHKEDISKNIRASIAHELGNLYKLLGYYAQAFQNFDMSLELFKQMGNMSDQILVTSDIGYTFCIIGKYKEAINILSPALEYMINYFGKDSIKAAKMALELGIANKYAGNFKESQKLFIQSAAIYEQSNMDFEFVKVTTHLGDIYTYMGQYIEARRLLEKNLTYYRNKRDTLGYAWTSRLLGRLYNEIGLNKKAQEILEHCLITYTRLYGHRHIKLIEILDNLTMASLSLGEYKEAQKYIEKCEEIHDMHIKMEIRNYFLDKIFLSKGRNENARKLLLDEYQIYKNYYGSDHIKTAKVLNDIGFVDLLEGNINSAEIAFHQALVIYEKNKHPERYRSLEMLAELYLMKSRTANLNSNNYQTEAIKCLKNAYKIVKVSFSEDSPHLHRIEQKLKNLS